jgi:hypothetical protein
LLVYILIGAIALYAVVALWQRATYERAPPAVNPTATPGVEREQIPREPIAPPRPKPAPQ